MSTECKTFVILNGNHCTHKKKDNKNNLIDIEELYGSNTACDSIKNNENCKKCVVKKSKVYYFPFRRHLKKGSIYEYCGCGRSNNFPFCDKSHTLQDVYKGNGPIQFKIIKEQTMHLLCGCHMSKHLPFCDGSHIYPSKKSIN